MPGYTTSHGKRMPASGRFYRRKKASEPTETSAKTTEGAKETLLSHATAIITIIGIIVSGIGLIIESFNLHRLGIETTQYFNPTDFLLSALRVLDSGFESIGYLFAILKLDPEPYGLAGLAELTLVAVIHYLLWGLFFLLVAMPILGKQRERLVRVIIRSDVRHLKGLFTLFRWFARLKSYAETRLAYTPPAPATSPAGNWAVFLQDVKQCWLFIIRRGAVGSIFTLEFLLLLLPWIYVRLLVLFIHLNAEGGQRSVNMFRTLASHWKVLAGSSIVILGLLSLSSRYADVLAIEQASKHIVPLLQSPLVRDTESRPPGSFRSSLLDYAFQLRWDANRTNQQRLIARLKPVDILTNRSTIIHRSKLLVSVTDEYVVAYDALCRTPLILPAGAVSSIHPRPYAEFEKDMKASEYSPETCRHLAISSGSKGTGLSPEHLEWEKRAAVIQQQVAADRQRVTQAAKDVRGSTRAAGAYADQARSSAAEASSAAGAAGSSAGSAQQALQKIIHIIAETKGGGDDLWRVVAGRSQLERLNAFRCHIVVEREAYVFPPGNAVKLRPLEDDISFFGGDELMTKIKPLLVKDLADLGVTMNQATFVVEGFTDRDDNWKRNFSLSQLRAESIAGWLSRIGVGSEQVIAIGHGEQLADAWAMPNNPADRTFRLRVCASRQPDSKSTDTAAGQAKPPPADPVKRISAPAKE